MQQPFNWREMLAAGNAAFVDDDYPDALNYYSNAIEKGEAGATALVNRSYTYYKLERYEGE